MYLRDQSQGLAQILKWQDGSGLVTSDKVIFAAVAASAAASPLATIAYRTKAPSIIGGAALAAGLAYRALPSSQFSAQALAPAPAIDVEGEVPAKPQAGLDLGPLWRQFHPWNIFKMLVKNVSIHMLIRFNVYQLLQHERDALAAEQDGLEPPPPPEFPDMKPAVVKGLAAFGREFAINTTRATYGCIAKWYLGPRKAQALLRNSKIWIRDVLSVKYRSASMGRRFGAYFWATMHGVALHYAADATVSLVQHTYLTFQRKKEDGNRLAYWAKGAVLQVARCVLLMFAASLGAALGGQANPVWGVMVGQTAAEFATLHLVGHFIDFLME